MAQYIDKDAVVAEIERLYNRAERRVTLEKEGLKAEDTRKYEDGLADAYDIILSFIDTIEVKEVDVDEAARHYLLHEHLSPLNNILHQADLKTEMQYHKDIESAFKAGYEFCLKVQKGEEYELHNSRAIEKTDGIGT